MWGFEKEVSARLMVHQHQNTQSHEDVYVANHLLGVSHDGHPAWHVAIHVAKLVQGSV